MQDRKVLFGILRILGFIAGATAVITGLWLKENIPVYVGAGVLTICIFSWYFGVVRKANRPEERDADEILYSYRSAGTLSEELKREYLKKEDLEEQLGNMKKQCLLRLPYIPVSLAVIVIGYYPQVRLVGALILVVTLIGILRYLIHFDNALSLFLARKLGTDSLARQIRESRERIDAIKGRIEEESAEALK